MENERIMIPFFIDKDKFDELSDRYEFAYFIISNIKNEGMPTNIDETALLLSLDYSDCSPSITH